MGKSQQPAALSPERTKLAAAIKDKRTDDLRRASVRAAHETAQAAAWAASAAVTQAEADLETAKLNAANHMVNVNMGSADGPAPVSIRQARAALSDAQDEHDAATAARDVLAKQLQAVEESPGFAPARLREAALAVIQAEAGDHARAVAERVAALMCDLVKYGNELKWLAGAGAFPLIEEPGSQYHRVKDPNIEAALNRLGSPSTTWTELTRVPDLQGHLNWVETMDRLMQDAAAPLPVKG